MIVDDDSSMRRLLESIISCSTIEVEQIIECASGEEAIKNYTIHKPNCVLMDVELIKMSGFEATEIIISQDNKAAIIIVTSYDTPTYRRKAKELGARGFVAKDNLSEIIAFINATEV